MAEVGQKRGAEDRAEPGGDAKRLMTNPAAVQGNMASDAPPSPDLDGMPLPPGWEEHVSKRTGKPFWYNAATKERTWYHPAITKPEPKSPESPTEDPPTSAFQLPPGLKPPNEPAPTLESHAQEQKTEQQQNAQQQQNAEQQQQQHAEKQQQHAEQQQQQQHAEQQQQKQHAEKEQQQQQKQHAEKQQQHAEQQQQQHAEQQQQQHAEKQQQHAEQQQQQHAEQQQQKPPEQHLQQQQQHREQTTQDQQQHQYQYRQGEHQQQREFGSGFSRNMQAVIHPLTRLPMRPGDVKCNHYVSHGTCKYGEACKFDHPPSCASPELVNMHAIPPGTPVPDGYALSGGLPVRDAEDCSFFIKTGMCKFGNSCKFNHPAELQTRVPTIARMPKKGEGKVAPQTPTALLGVEAAPRMAPGPMGMHAMLPYSHPAAPPAAPGGMPFPWEMHRTDEGRPYYFNAVTQVSQWHPPPELDRPRGPTLMPSGGFPTPANAPLLSPNRGVGGFPNPVDPVTGQHKFPVRPGQSDCAFFIKTGDCSYGPNCKFNHPPDGRPSSDREQYTDVYPVREGVSDCSFYMKTGECRFGLSCKYNHPPKETLGLPVREGRENCPFYMKTGVCSFGRQCKYNHPPDLSAAAHGHGMVGQVSAAGYYPLGLSVEALGPAPTM